MKADEKEVIYTGSIPQCPYCYKPTQRTGGESTRTLMYCVPRYDENGVNVSVDRNIVTSYYQCLECMNHFAIKGNKVNGFKYLIKD